MDDAVAATDAALEKAGVDRGRQPECGQGDRRHYRSTIVDSPDLFGHVNLARLTQDMRDIGGTRSASVGLFVAGMPFGPDRLQATTEMTGKVALLWQTMQQVVPNLGNPPELTKALDHVRSTMMTEGEQRFQGVIDAARKGAAPPMSLADWCPWVTRMLNNILVLQDAAIAAAQTRGSASQVLDASTGLTRQAAVLRREIEIFLAGIRAA
ncbi:hypothetical protein ABNQ38_11185 [Azospirillum sp. A29]|uniref:hypothetical protein n=1 Tax=Azospirillum sp. A29 TaxID=3160606 RepID=UPI003672C11F